MGIDTIITNLITNLFPSAAQFVMVLIALVGSFIVFFALNDMYKMISDGVTRTYEGSTVSGSMIRVLIGGFMVVPSAVLWRSADAFLGGAPTSEASVLAYISGTLPTTTCDRFGAAVQLMFLIVGLMAIFFAFRNADDQARGFDRNGYRQAVPRAIGGLLCIFIPDIFDILSDATGVDLGMANLCTVLG